MKKSKKIKQKNPRNPPQNKPKQKTRLYNSFTLLSDQRIGILENFKVCIHLLFTLCKRNLDTIEFPLTNLHIWSLEHLNLFLASKCIWSRIIHGGLTWHVFIWLLGYVRRWNDGGWADGEGAWGSCLSRSRSSWGWDFEYRAPGSHVWPRHSVLRGLKWEGWCDEVESELEGVC